MNPDLTMQLTTLSLFQIDKYRREMIIHNTLSDIESGNIDPLKVHVQVKNMEKIIKSLSDNEKYRKALVDAADSYGEKKFNFMGSEMEKKEAGVKYDFSKCNDPVLVDLAIKFEEAKVKLEKRQSLLKTIPKAGLPMIDPDTGETYTAYPPAKSSTTIVQCTLK